MTPHQVRSYLLKHAERSGMSERHEPGRCEIRLKGHLDARWAEWFGDLTLTREGDGTTVLRGPVAEQAALHGLLGRVRDLGLPLISVAHAEPAPHGLPQGEQHVITDRQTPECSSPRPSPDKTTRTRGV